TTAAVYAAFMAMYPTNAIDVYIYAARSRLLTAYGDNPNAVRPVTYWDTDPYMHYASQEWADNLSPYGPLWNQLAAPVTWLGGDSIGEAILGFKLLSAGAAIATAWFIHAIVRDRHPEWALPAALFWLWNPLVLWDGIGNAHNDVTLMLPVVAALWAWQKRLDHWVIPLLLASVLIKYVTLILIPVALVAVWRRNPDSRERVAGILWSASAMLFLFAVSLYPFFHIDAIVTSAREQGALVAASPAWVVMASLQEWSIAVIPRETIINVAYAIAAIYIAGWMVACWRDPERLPRAAFEVMFAFMLVASTNQRAWYVIWIVPLAALLIPATPWRRTLLWSVTAMMGHACTIWLWFMWDFEAWGYYRYILIIVTVVFLPVIALTLREGINALRVRTDRSESTRAVTSTG
ncbi:MAG: DUF2029 domain-containing protein, partial [Chloroflexia bacterium]|nr:DUF2029 domain-containing protein [Chloroflexia bacterium]